MFFFKKMKPLPLCLSLRVTGQMEVMALHSKLKKQFLLKKPRKTKKESQRPDNMLHSTFHNIAKLLIDEALRTTVQIKHTL